MHCVNAVRDDLHDYAAGVLANLTQHLSTKPLDARSFGNVNCAILHRLGNLQTEIVTIQPGQLIPLHTHPGVDSVDLLVAGMIDLTVGDLRIPKPLKRVGVRIPQDCPHGGEAGAEGVTFLSCQRWAVPPSYIGLAWRGEPCSVLHHRMIGALEGLR